MFENVEEEEFAANLATRGETGAAFAAVRDGELVVDLWGGVADVERVVFVCDEPAVPDRTGKVLPAAAARTQ